MIHHRFSLHLSLALLVLAGLFLPGRLAADMVSFPKERTVNGQTFTLRGEAVLRVGMVFRVYRAAFYMGRDIATERVLEDVPMRLEVNYYRSISRDQLIMVADEILNKIATREELESIRERLETLNGWYQSVERGDLYTLTYLPDIGLELAFNGEVLGVVEGHDFARVYLAIWLGDHPYSRGLNRKLLGGD